MYVSELLNYCQLPGYLIPIFVDCMVRDEKLLKYSHVNDVTLVLLGTTACEGFFVHV